MLNANIQQTVDKVNSLSQNYRRENGMAGTSLLQTMEILGCLGFFILNYSLLPVMGIQGSATLSSMILLLPEVPLINSMFQWTTKTFKNMTFNRQIPNEFDALTIEETSNLIDEFNKFFKLESGYNAENYDPILFVNYLVSNSKLQTLKALTKLGLDPQLANSCENNIKDTLEAIQKAEFQKDLKSVGLSNHDSLQWQLANFIAKDKKLLEAVAENEDCEVTAVKPMIEMARKWQAKK